MIQTLELGFDKKSLFRNILIGLGVGIFFVFLINFSSGFSIGIPSVPLAASDTARTFIVGFIAPIAEEIFFGLIMAGIIASILSFKGAGIGTFTITTIGVALLFSIFHLAAFSQGQYVAGSTPFFGAFVFRIVAQFMIRTVGLTSSIILHSSINLGLLAQQVIA